jgi:small multidrug resistance family-3 protein
VVSPHFSGMRSLFWFVIAALGEIAGCYAFWLWLRQHRGPWPLLLGIPALLVFAYALTRVETTSAARSYAAYSAIYLAASLVWMRTVEQISPDRWDLLGAGVCLLGAGIIMFAPR